MEKELEKIESLLTEIRDLGKQDFELRQKAVALQEQVMKVQGELTQKAQKNFKKVFIYVIVAGIIVIAVIIWVISILIVSVLPYLR